MLTPKYELYHRDTLWFPLGQDLAEPVDPAALGWPERYRHVADLRAQSLEAAYARSQHLEQVWWRNPGVIPFEESRSTSVGDVLVDAADVAWVVAPLGFVRVGKADDLADQDQAGREIPIDC